MIDVKHKGVAIGVFQFGTTLSGTLATVIVGFLITEDHVKE